MSDKTKSTRKKNYGAGGKRKEIRYVTRQGFRIPIGNAALSVNPDLVTKSVDAKLKVPVGDSTLTVGGNPRTKSGQAAFTVPVRGSTLTVGGSASPGKRSVGVKVRVPLRGKKKK